MFFFFDVLRCVSRSFSALRLPFAPSSVCCSASGWLVNSYACISMYTIWMIWMGRTMLMAMPLLLSTMIRLRTEAELKLFRLRISLDVRMPYFFFRFISFRSSSVLYFTITFRQITKPNEKHVGNVNVLKFFAIINAYTTYTERAIEKHVHPAAPRSQFTSHSLIRLICWRVATILYALKINEIFWINKWWKEKRK